MKPEPETRLSRKWQAVDTIQGFSSPYELQRAATLTPDEIAFLCDLIGDCIERSGDPEGDIAPIRTKLRGRP